MMLACGMCGGTLEILMLGAVSGIVSLIYYVMGLFNATRRAKHTDQQC